MKAALLIIAWSGVALAGSTGVVWRGASGITDFRETLERPTYATSVCWIVANANPASYATWKVEDGSPARNDAVQSDSAKRPAWLSGATNRMGCLLFDGANDVITTALTGHSGAAFTVLAWVRFSQRYRQPVSVCGENADTFRWFLGTGSTSGLVWSIRNGTMDTVQITTTVVPAVNEWLMLCGTYSSGASALYLNGVQVSTASGSTVPSANTALAVGYSANAFTWGAHQLSAAVDGVIVANVALSSNAVMNMYHATK